MSILKSKILGESIVCISHDIDTWSISFSNNSGLTCNTKLSCSLVCAYNEYVVTDVVMLENELQIKIGKESEIRIDLTDKYMSGPEYFVYRDKDGNYIIEN